VYASLSCANLSDLGFQRDQYAESLDHLEQALAIARRIGDRTGEWFALSEMTYALTMLGRWDEALALLEELTDEQIASGAMFLSLLTTHLEIHVHRGRLDRARHLYELFARLEASADVQERAIWLGATAALRRAEGDDRGALAAGRAAAETSAQLGLAHQAAKQGLVEAVEAALALGAQDEAAGVLATIDAMPPGLRPPYLEAQAHRIRGQLDGDEAAYRAAASRFRSLRIPFWLAVTQLEHAELLTGLGRPDDAEPLLTDSRATFEELAAVPWLERAVAVAGTSRPIPA
jgi:tetratricopeptide (TPR) repeat protein